MDYFSAAPKTRNTTDTGLEMDSNEFALYPANGNRMALTLLLLLDQANRESQFAREDSRKQSYEPNNLMPLGRNERECFFRNIKGERKEEEGERRKEGGERRKQRGERKEEGGEKS